MAGTTRVERVREHQWMGRLRDDNHWAEYNAAQAGREVRPLCRELMELAGDGGGRTGIDLGCGLGRETRALLAAGWRVHAVDGEPGTRHRVLATAAGAAPGDRLTIQVARFAALTELPPADLVYAGYSLPYTHPRDFDRVWAVIRACLRPGAWIAANLFGDRDEWAADPETTFLPPARARALFDGMGIVRFHEQDEDGMAYSGPKHWHRYDVIARMPGTG